ncbi:MAG: MBL fold metallo-hydrolase [Patescibacteria group bacterium]
MSAFIVIFLTVTLGINHFLRARGHHGPKSDHFNGTHFFNIRDRSRFVNRIRDKRNNPITAFATFLIKSFDKKVWYTRLLPLGESIPVPRVVGKKIVVTLVGHSTVLIQTEGLNILTDPVWAKRASPVQFFGPKRFMRPGIFLDDLPKIDFILQTHNHYDHMDVKTLRMISERDHPVIYTTLGNGDYLRDRAVYGSVEMDWGDSKSFSDLISIDCVPAQHFSARALTDRNRTLWGGFVIRTPHGNIYFAGDSGYGPYIERIKKVYPEGFRLAFLPIGAYEPHVLMGIYHMSPDEAVTIYKELKVRHAIPIHFGTFDLALDAQDDPVQRLDEILAEPDNAEVKFIVLYNGEVGTVK